LVERADKLPLLACSVFSLPANIPLADLLVLPPVLSAMDVPRHKSSQERAKKSKILTWKGFDTMTTFPATLTASLKQLVLFPEVVGAQALPLDQDPMQKEVPADEQQEQDGSIQHALDAGQLPLFW
jgi:hypothetical protein